MYEKHVSLSKLLKKQKAELHGQFGFLDQRTLSTKSRDFLGGPVAKTQIAMQEPRFSLFSELDLTCCS